MAPVVAVVMGGGGCAVAATTAWGGETWSVTLGASRRRLFGGSIALLMIQICNQIDDETHNRIDVLLKGQSTIEWAVVGFGWGKVRRRAD